MRDFFEYLPLAGSVVVRRWRTGVRGGMGREAVEIGGISVEVERRKRYMCWRFSAMRWRRRSASSTKEDSRSRIKVRASRSRCWRRSLSCSTRRQWARRVVSRSSVAGVGDESRGRDDGVVMRRGSKGSRKCADEDCCSTSTSRCVISSSTSMRLVASVDSMKSSLYWRR